MRIVSVIALAACFLSIASAKDSMTKQKDAFGDDSSKLSSIDPRSSTSNWVPLVLRRHGYDDNGPKNGYGDNGLRNGYGDNGPRNGYADNGPRHGYDGNGPRNSYVDNGPRHGYGANGKGINSNIDYPVVHDLAVGPPIYRSQNQVYDPIGKAYLRVEMEHPIYHGRTFPSNPRDVQTGAPSRPSSGVITVTSNADRYSGGSYGNQGQGSITPLALGSDYGSASAGQASSNANTGYNDSPTNYPGYQSSAYTDASSSQSGPTSDYSNSLTASGNGYSSYDENSYNYDVPSTSYNYDVSNNYQTGPSSDSGSGYQTGAYASTPSAFGGYTSSPAPSSGYVGYGGTFHNYGQQVSYPVAYRGRLPRLFVMGTYGTPWAANQIEQEAGYYLYR